MLSPRDEVRLRKLLRAARRGDRDARARLVEHHLGAVRSLASRYRDCGVPYEDLVQEGSLGLLEAIDGYDATRGSSFDAYARFRIRRAIRNALTDRGRLIRLPKHVVERRRALERVRARLLAAGGSSAPADLAAATGLSSAVVLEALSAAHAPISLDAPVLPDGATLASLTADPAATDPAAETVEREEMQMLERALARLSERQRRVVSAQWGLGRAPVASTTEIAVDLELSPRRTQTIGHDALFELRKALEPAANA